MSPFLFGCQFMLVNLLNYSISITSQIKRVVSMSGQLFFSIITPVYNGEKFLNENAQSWLKQTYQNFEVIYVDDGSSDNSRNLIEEIVKCDQRFKLVCQDHVGIAQAIKRGIQEAGSNYIVFMDQDDIAMPWRLEKTAEAFANGAELIMGDYEIIDELGKPTGRIISFPSFITSENLLLEQFKRTYFLGSAMAFKYKGDFEFHVDSGGATDYDISLKMLLRDYQFVYIPDILIRYRVHNRNTSANYSKQKQDVKTIFSPYEHQDLFQHLLKKGFNPFEVSLSLGICYLFQNNLDVASPYLQKAMLLINQSDRRTYQECMFYNSVLYFLLDEYSKSFELLHDLVKKGYNNPSIFNNIGVMFVYFAQTAKAKEWFNQAYDLNKQYSDVAHNLKLLNDNHVDYRDYKFTTRLLREVLTHIQIK
ncbi:glycosyltransferase [Geobacillus sp. Geo 8.1]